MRSVILPLPPLADQVRIILELERRLSIVEEVEATVAADLKRAERMRQAILKRAFSGNLVLQDPAEEPASALLERIRAENKPVSKTAQPVLSFEFSPPNPPIPGARPIGRQFCI